MVFKLFLPFHRLSFHFVNWSFCCAEAFEFGVVHHGNSGSSAWGNVLRRIRLSRYQFSSVAQSCPTLCDPMNRSTPGLLFITISRSSLRLTSVESVMPSSHLILCHPLFLLPPIPPSIRVFSNESTLLTR